jgi:hypothetical protein
VNSICQAAATCSDVVKNGAETDVDCGGGVCMKCVDGKVCVGNTDCVSNLCLNGRCVQPATCSDGVRNGSETGVDCGGSCPTKCPEGGGCVVSADCVSGNCSGGTCQTVVGSAKRLTFTVKPAATLSVVRVRVEVYTIGWTPVMNAPCDSGTQGGPISTFQCSLDFPPATTLVVWNAVFTLSNGTTTVLVGWSNGDPTVGNSDRGTGTVSSPTMMAFMNAIMPNDQKTGYNFWSTGM